MSELGQVTFGDFETEKDAELFFDNSLPEEYFYNEKEVRGRRLFDDKPIKAGSDGQNVRIDRIIYPTQKAVEAGWINGPIAVEIKKSGMALGPIFAQVLEYRSSVFLSRLLGNARIIPMCFAIFPMYKITHDLHSLMESQLILSCSPAYGGGLKFGTHGKTAFVVDRGKFELGHFEPTTRKGHRSREK